MKIILLIICFIAIALYFNTPTTTEHFEPLPEHYNNHIEHINNTLNTHIHNNEKKPIIYKPHKDPLFVNNNDIPMQMDVAVGPFKVINNHDYYLINEHKPTLLPHWTNVAATVSCRDDTTFNNGQCLLNY